MPSAETKKGISVRPAGIRDFASGKKGGPAEPVVGLGSPVNRSEKKERKHWPVILVLSAVSVAARV
jgi:hypothetical protein